LTKYTGTSSFLSCSVCYAEVTIFGKWQISTSSWSGLFKTSQIWCHSLWTLDA